MKRGEALVTECAQVLDKYRITAAPASWQSSAIRRSHGTTSSFQTSRLLNTGGLSRLTLADPAVITIATPALARST